MQTNLLLAGVGGQGILSIAYVVDSAALAEGLHVRQAEVHGMSQRGGEVQSHLRLSDKPIHSALIPSGTGTLVLSVEPLEALRYVELLAPEGAVVTGVEPFENIGNYPEVGKLLAAVAALPNHTLVPAERLARAAGSARAANMVLLGAASPFLGLSDARLEASIEEAFARKGERIVKTNLTAFRAGKAAGARYRELVKAGVDTHAALEQVAAAV